MDKINENINEFIAANHITKAINLFDCPFCETQHGDETALFYGPQIHRAEEGYDFKQVVLCEKTQKLYWYLNGV